VSAAWLTAIVGVASFVVGVVLPFLFKRFSHEGYSLREVPWGRFGAISVKVGQTGAKHGVFGVIKAANANPDPILIEALRLAPLATVFQNSNDDDIRQNLYLLDVDRDRAITFPPVDADLHRWKTLPLVLEPRAERELALWISVEFNDRETMNHRPFEHLKPIRLMWKVSGKSRKLKDTPKSEAISISLEVTEDDGTRDLKDFRPVQLCPPGAAPSQMPPREALGLRPGVSVSHLNLSGIDLAEGRLEEVRLDLVNLDRAKMARISMSKSRLSNVTAIGADLTDAQLDETRLADVKLDHAKLSGVNMSGSRLNNISATGADLTGVCLVQAVLDNTILKEAKLVSANLEGITGNTVVMTDANASDANLARAQLPAGDLTRIDLSRADLRWANLAGASLVDADLTGARLHGLTFPELT
jgi:uncharacterized protein YjbI with pentapeptide repeats